MYLRVLKITRRRHWRAFGTQIILIKQRKIRYRGTKSAGLLEYHVINITNIASQLYRWSKCAKTYDGPLLLPGFAPICAVKWQTTGQQVLVNSVEKLFDLLRRVFRVVWF